MVCFFLSVVIGQKIHDLLKKKSKCITGVTFAVDRFFLLIWNPCNTVLSAIVQTQPNNNIITEMGDTLLTVVSTKILNDGYHM